MEDPCGLKAQQGLLVTNKVLTEKRAQSATSHTSVFLSGVLGGVSNLSGIWSKVHEAKSDPFPKLGLKLLPRITTGSLVEQESTDQLRGGLSVGSAQPQWKLLMTLVSFSVNEGSRTGDDLSLTPTLAPTMTLTHNRGVHSKYDFLSSSFLLITISPYAPKSH